MPGTGVLVDLSPLRDSPPFRNIVIARTIAVLGIGMLMVAVPIQIYDLTGSTVLVGTASAVTGIATSAGLLVGGVLADRYDRRRLIVCTRTICGFAFAGLAVNAALPAPSLWAVLAFGAIDGAVGAVSITALLAATPALVPRDAIAAAGAINALTVQIGMTAGPAIGGFVIAAGGVAWNYGAAALGTLATVPVLAAIPPLRPGRTATESPVEALVGGVRFAVTEPTVRAVLAVGTIALLGGGTGVLVPAFVDERFGGDARAAGALYAALGVGAAVGAVCSGWIARTRRKGRALMVALVVSFAALACVGTAPWIALAFALVAVAGACVTVQEIAAYTLVQTHTPDHLLGRANSLWSTQNVLGLAVGSAVAGAVGSVFVASTALVVYGTSVMTLAVVALLALGGLRRHVDRVPGDPFPGASDAAPDPTRPTDPVENR